MKRFFACALLCAAAAFGQTTAAAPAGEVLGYQGNFIHVVSNLDNSLAFYHDVIRLEIQRAGGARGNGAGRRRLCPKRTALHHDAGNSAAVRLGGGAVPRRRGHDSGIADAGGTGRIEGRGAQAGAAALRRSRRV